MLQDASGPDQGDRLGRHREGRCVVRAQGERVGVVEGGRGGVERRKRRDACTDAFGQNAREVDGHLAVRAARGDEIGEQDIDASVGRVAGRCCE